MQHSVLEDASLADDIVGRAVDGAMAQLEPYSRLKQPKWWAHLAG